MTSSLERGEKLREGKGLLGAGAPLARAYVPCRRPKLEVSRCASSLAKAADAEPPSALPTVAD